MQNESLKHKKKTKPADCSSDLTRGRQLQLVGGDCCAQQQPTAELQADGWLWNRREACSCCQGNSGRGNGLTCQHTRLHPRQHSQSHAHRA